MVTVRPRAVTDQTSNCELLGDVLERKLDTHDACPPRISSHTGHVVPLESKVILAEIVVKTVIVVCREDRVGQGSLSQREEA